MIYIYNLMIKVMKEEMNLKKIWKEKNVGVNSKINLSRKEILSLRRKRESQLTGSVKSAVITGLSIKFTLLVAIVVFTLMAFELGNLIFSISVLFLITAGSIIYDLYLLKLIAGMNNYADNFESRLSKLNDFLSVHIPVFQIVNSLSTPVMIILGMFYYHFLKYSKFEFRAVDDVIVFVSVTLIGYAISYIAGKYSLNAFRNEARDLLDSGNDQDAIADYEAKRRKNRRKRLLISLIILFTGITLLVLLLLA